MISVVIPVFNAERRIRRCLDSLAAQACTDLEIICVDDGSSDGSGAVIESWSAAHPDIPLRLITRENAGAPAARNAGLSVARGELIQFLDDDDELLPAKLERQVGLAADADLVAGAYVIRPAGGEDRLVGVDRQAHPLASLMRGLLGSTCSNLYRAEAVRAVGGWDESKRSAQDFWFALAILGRPGARLAFDDQPLTIVHHGTDERISTRDRPGNSQRYLEAVEAIYLEARDQVSEQDLKLCRDTLFGALRGAYPWHPEHASRVFRQHFPPGYRPGESASTSRNYIRVFNVVGFRGAQFLSGIARRFYSLRHLFKD